MRHVDLVPAIIPRSKADLESLARQLTAAPELSVDVVDGQFVPFTAWPYEPAGHPEEVAKLLAAWTLEVDLMVVDQITAASTWVAAGADMLVFHLPGVSLQHLAAFAEGCRASIGVSPPSDMAVADLEPFVPHIDYIQLMGIAEIGAQGQPFDQRVLERIVECKERFPQLPVSVDGSVNRETIPALVQAGVDRLTVGSAIVKQSDPAAAYAELRAFINECA